MFGRRSDGKRIKTIDPYFKIVPHIMPKRYDAMIFFKHEVRCEPLDEFIRAQRELGNNFNYMDIIIASAVRLLALRPKLNRFIMNGRIFKRNNIQISFTIKKVLKDDAPDTTIKLTFTGHENLQEVKAKIDEEIKKNVGLDKTNETDKLARFLTIVPNGMIKFVMAILRFMDRHGMIPKKLLDASPFHTSCFITNLKSIKLDYVYHHIYDFGTTSIFIAMGKEKMMPVVDENNDLAVGKVMTLGFVTDERICDGLYYGNSLRMLKRILKNPEVLLERLEKVEQDIK